MACGWTGTDHTISMLRLLVADARVGLARGGHPWPRICGRVRAALILEGTPGALMRGTDRLVGAWMCSSDGLLGQAGAQLSLISFLGLLIWRWSRPRPGLRLRLGPGLGRVLGRQGLPERRGIHPALVPCDRDEVVSTRPHGLPWYGTRQMARVSARQWFASGSDAPCTSNPAAP